MEGDLGIMNNNSQNQAVLSDVLDALQMSGQRLTGEVLSEWMRRYPQFEREIMDFAAFDAVLGAGAAAGKGAEEIDDVVIRREVSEANLARVRTIVARVISERPGVGEKSSSIISLTAAAAVQNMRFPQIAQKAGLSIPLLANLEQRFIKFASIPEEIIGRLAEVLKTSTAAVATYLQMPPIMTTGANFKSKDQPELPADQSDFFALVESDQMLSIAQKQDLLKLKK